MVALCGKLHDMTQIKRVNAAIFKLDVNNIMRSVTFIKNPWTKLNLSKRSKRSSMI